MLFFIEVILFVIGIILFVPIAMLLIECVAAIVLERSQSGKIQVRPSVGVLVPAHNEAVGIAATIDAIAPQLTDLDRLVVIADNCTDCTAAIARQLGATVIERQDPERRGKGFALDYGLQFLATEPPEVVVCVDADCIVEPSCIDKIAKMALATAKPVQATYLMAQPAKPRPNDSISALAFMVKNLVRPRGLTQLGLPCLLTGTGMAFPWSVISQVSLASSNLVEDMQMSVDLAIAGFAPKLCLDAKVLGRLPQQNTAAKNQRTRWEQGHLQTLTTQVPRLLKEFMHQQRFDLLALALDLCVPPLSLLVLMWLVVATITLSVGLLSALWMPAIFLALEGLLIFISILGAWAKFGQAQLPLRLLLAVPFYILWKIPLYLGYLVKPQTKWIRTERDTVNAPNP